MEVIQVPIRQNEGVTQYVRPTTAIPERAEAVIGILGVNPLRAEILRYLWQHPDGGTSGDIGRSIGTGYKTVLWHLKQLESTGAVDTNARENRIGQRVIYSINQNAFNDATDDFLKYVKGH
ncbi:winged helix-turn-helix domain-containing protein [Arthrobacter sp.]|uniref:winged helix-turn-helix domain-containing protein n=1 Tax=Arthrobacter sp. TaxID=1667 RepID=UPI0026DEB953|nr:helix-turn-helix domain-containing protein [Arthrobacter sp.]MDO5752448.1 helix-turn-helix domain-containing protein [Arthrobacter sp.]